MGGLVLVPLMLLPALPPIPAGASTDGQASTLREAQIPIDGRPKKTKVNGDTLTIYQPQVESWQGDVLEARTAVAALEAVFADVDFEPDGG